MDYSASVDLRWDGETIKKGSLIPKNVSSAQLSVWKRFKQVEEAKKSTPQPSNNQKNSKPSVKKSNSSSAQGS